MRSTRDLADLYLHLLVEAVNGSLYGPQTFLVPHLDGEAREGVVLAEVQTVPSSAYDGGDGWPSSRLNIGTSMVGRARLANVRQAVETVIREEVPGHLIETGVWRGGACILMRGVLAAHGVGDRLVYAADSFEGLPVADMTDDAAYLHDDSTLEVGLDEVKAAFERHGLLDDQVKFLPGWFKDTLPALADLTWAVVRLDGDMYESTMDGITNLYPGLSRGGYLIIDDYFTYESCRRAIDEYRQQHAISEPMIQVDANCVYWRKG
jgi:O-methyltransferase